MTDEIVFEGRAQPRPLAMVECGLLLQLGDALTMEEPPFEPRLVLGPADVPWLDRLEGEYLAELSSATGGEIWGDARRECVADIRARFAKRIQTVARRRLDAPGCEAWRFRDERPLAELESGDRLWLLRMLDVVHHSRLWDAAPNFLKESHLNRVRGLDLALIQRQRLWADRHVAQPPRPYRPHEASWLQQAAYQVKLGIEHR